MSCCRVVAVRATDKRIACDEEFSDSEDEGEGGRRNVSNQKKGAKRPRADDDDKEAEEKKTGGYFQLVFQKQWKFSFLHVTDLFSV